MSTQSVSYPNQVKWKALIIILALVLCTWLFVPVPYGLSTPAWQTLIIFVSCIASPF